jgi:hypothetical protein
VYRILKSRTGRWIDRARRLSNWIDTHLHVNFADQLHSVLLQRERPLQWMRCDPVVVENVKRVHEDVSTLIKHGLVVRTADRRICVPYDIYATLWALQFPRFREFHIGCEWVTVIA